MDVSVIAFLHNAALLLAVAVIFDVALDPPRTDPSGRAGQLLVGAVLAVIGVAIMLTPFQFAPGLFFDTRAVLLTIAGLFFGPLASFVPMLAMVAFRVALGGSGAPSGVVVIAFAWAMGVAWQRWRGHALDKMTLREMGAFGLVASAAVFVVAGVGLGLTLPASVAQPATRALALPSVLVNPVATALLGAVLLNRLKRRRLAVANERLQAELEAQLGEVRASRARIVAAADEERKRVERDIHDGAQQRLVGLSLTLRLLRSKLGSGASPDVIATLDQASSDAKAALTELRELARGIHPQILTETGLGPAIESLADRAPFPVRLEIDANGRYGPAAESAAYFTVSESLANVAKYAEASTAAVRVVEVGGKLRIEVRDDGVGGADPAAGTGLRGLTDRLAAIDATLDVISPKGGGTHVIASIPVRPAHGNPG